MVGLDSIRREESGERLGRGYPQSLNEHDHVAMTRHGGVVGYQTHRFNNRLGYQQAVKRIVVVGRKPLNGNSVFRFDTQEAIPCLTKIVQRIAAGYGHLAPPQAVLDSDFP